MKKHVKTRNVPEGFKRSAFAEWARLNPHYIQPGDSFGAVLVHAARETLPGFFAPLRIAGWILRYIFAAAIQGKKK